MKEGGDALCHGGTDSQIHETASIEGSAIVLSPRPHRHLRRWTYTWTFGSDTRGGCERRGYCGLGRRRDRIHGLDFTEEDLRRMKRTPIRRMWGNATPEQ
jgi:hypothetical protein